MLFGNIIDFSFERIVVPAKAEFPIVVSSLSNTAVPIPLM